MCSCEILPTLREPQPPKLALSADVLLVLNLLRTVPADIGRLYGALLCHLGFLSHLRIMIPLEYEELKFTIILILNLLSNSIKLSIIHFYKLHLLIYRELALVS